MVFFINIKWYFNKSSYKQSHSRNVVYLHKQLHLASISLLDESAFLHVVKWMIQWLIHKDPCTCFVPEQISHFERMAWMYDSLIETL